MAKTTKPLPVVEWEIGIKNRAPVHIMADKMSANASYGADSAVVLSLRGQCILVVARQKWDYVKLITPVP